jgi:hypothetical protein
VVISNSTKAGVTADPLILASFGVVIDTRHFTRVNGTASPAVFSLFSTWRGVFLSSMLDARLTGQF